MNIYTNSWHYELIRRYALNDWNSNPSNLCDYMKALLKAFVIMFMVAFLVTFGALIYAIGAMAFYFWFFKGIPGEYWQTQYIIGFVVITWIALMIAYMEAGINQRIKNSLARRNTSQDNKPSSIFSVWYQGLKEKVCVTINYKD